MMQGEKFALPMLPLRGIVVFPSTITNFEVVRETSLKALDKVMEKDARIFLVTQKNPRMESPEREDIFSVGVIAKVRHILKISGGMVRVLAEGLQRARLIEYTLEDCYMATVEDCTQSAFKGEKAAAYMRSLIEKYEEFGLASNRVSQEALLALSEIKSPSRLADTVAVGLVKEIPEKQGILETLDIEERLQKVINHAVREKNIAMIESEISKKTKSRLEQTQKEHYLREQIRSIQSSLGEEENPESEADKIKAYVKTMPVAEDTKEKLQKEAARMEHMNMQSPDYNVMLNYFEWIMALPFRKYTVDDIDIARAKKALNRHHYGMTKVKERILEYLSICKLTGKVQGNILCFIGPPGVGKTSIAKAIAEAMGRKFVRMSLGGVRDEAEIRGHRRTYVGSIPGRIISNIRRAGTMNPVFLLDEIDKMASDFRGDPTAALLEVLDEEVNQTFQDHYLDIDFDLSGVMFIATANNADDIPPALYDRMEIIELDSYTPYEKEQIALRHLISKQLEKHGMNKEILHIQPSAVRAIISGYTRESGVRELERCIADICRKAAKAYVEKGDRILVKKNNLVKYLGNPRYMDTKLPKEAAVGTAIGLAWTRAGGTTLPIEVSVMEGSGETELTGQMGDVMKESAKTAISLVRSHAESLGISAEFHKKKDIHIHIPEGAVPKDGPSAGITMALAVASALSGRKVRRDIAMTGEVTLSGHVLMIGGLREKTFAAYRAGIYNVILPKDNMVDLEEIPKEIRSKLHFFPVTEFREVVEIGLGQEKQHAD